MAGEFVSYKESKVEEVAVIQGVRGRLHVPL